MTIKPEQRKAAIDVLNYITSCAPDVPSPDEVGEDLAAIVELTHNQIEAIRALAQQEDKP